MKLQANWGHASVRQLRCVSVHSDGKAIGWAICKDKSLGHREIRRAFEKATHIRIARTPTAAAFNGTSQVDLLFADYTIASRATDVHSKHSLLNLALP